MNELFNQEGHLTDFAFEALLHDYSLDEMERLEIAEHLSFCDECVEKYAGLLSGEDLLAPLEPVAMTVLQKIRERARRIFVNKYATVVAAASFAIIFWSAGFFNIDVTSDNSGKVIKAFANGATNISEKTTRFSDDFTETLNKIMNSFNFERGPKHEKK